MTRMDLSVFAELCYIAPVSKTLISSFHIIRYDIPDIPDIPHLVGLKSKPSGCFIGKCSRTLQLSCGWLITACVKSIQNPGTLVHPKLVT